MLIHDVEQNSPEWDALRQGMPTSSSFSSLVTGEGKPSTSLKKYASKLAAEKYLKSIGRKITDGFQGNQYTERGHALEAEAQNEYQMRYQVVIEPVGFCTDDLLRYGSSTDGFIGDDGVFEAKNLIATTFWDALIYSKRHKKPEPKYIPQLQGELLVTQRKYADLFLYNPDFDEPIIHRVYPDLEYHALLKTQITACILERDQQVKVVTDADS